MKTPERQLTSCRTHWSRQALGFVWKPWCSAQTVDETWQLYLHPTDKTWPLDRIHQWDSWFTTHICIAAMLPGARKHCEQQGAALPKDFTPFSSIHKRRQIHTQVPPAAMILSWSGLGIQRCQGPSWGHLGCAKGVWSDLSTVREKGNLEIRILGRREEAIWFVSPS